MESASTIIKALLERKLFLATAESCSGGLIGHYLTNVAGASGCYQGGVIAYSNAIKTALLSVPKTLLEGHGAVSEAVAQAMAQGVRDRFSADWSIAVTGIAGPGGGTADKPVGLVYIGLAEGDDVTVVRKIFHGDRSIVRQRSVITALAMLRERLL